MGKHLALAICVIAGLTCWAVVGTAQQVPRFSAGVDLIQVDVSVLDRNRRPVTGLTADQFSISEDGKPQPVVAFAEVLLPDTPAGTVPTIPQDVVRNDTVSDHRLLVIVMDDALMPQDAVVVNSAKDIARKLISQLAPGDLASVVFTSDSRGAQAFTNDRARLMTAIDAFHAGAYTPRNLFSPEKAIRYMEAARSLNMTRTLRLLMGALGSVPDRRKAVVNISVGAPVEAGRSGLLDPADPTPQVSEDVREIIRLAQRGNVNIYNVDPAGLDGVRLILDRETPSTRFEVEVREFKDRVESLSRFHRDFGQVLADNTGGHAFINTNDFSKGVDQILKETGSFYLLGYRSPNTASDGRFRRIQVRVNRPGFTTNARRGYYAPDPPDPRRPQRPDPNSGLQTQLLPASGLPLWVAAAPFAVDKEREARIPIVIGLQAPTASRSNSPDRVKVVATAYSSEGQVRGGDSLEVDVAPNGTGRATEADYEIFGQLKLAPGRYQLRIAAESGLLATSGSAFYDLDVPDFSQRLALSGLIVSTETPVPSAPRDRFAGFLPVLPTTRRSFAAADRVAAFVRVYQSGGRATRMTVTMQISDAAGKVVFDLPREIGSDQVGEAGVLDQSFDLSAAQLRPGAYVLTILAKMDATTVRRDTHIVIR